MSDLGTLASRLLEIYPDREGLSIQDMIQLRNEFGFNTKQFLALEAAAKDGEFSPADFRKLEGVFGKKRIQRALSLFYESPRALLYEWHGRVVEELTGDRWHHGKNYILFPLLNNLHLKEDRVVQGISFPKNAELYFNREGRLDFAYLDLAISGSKVIVAGREYPKGVTLVFDSELKVRQIRVYFDGEFSGMPIKQDEILHLNESGKVVKKDHFNSGLDG